MVSKQRWLGLQPAARVFRAEFECYQCLTLILNKEINMKIKANLLLVSLFASLSSLAAETYQVSTSVYANGELVASPVIVVEADKMAAITMDNGFSYNLTIKPNQDETTGVVAAVTVGGSTMNPSFTVAYGKEAIMEIGAQKLTLLVSKVGS